MRIAVVLCLILATVLQTGCLSDSSAQRWTYPEVAAPNLFYLASNDIETAYTTAVRLHKRQDPRCVEAYYRCLQLTAAINPNHSSQSKRIQSIHRSALINLLQTAQDHHRYQPGIGFLLCETSNTYIPIELVGFEWNAEDFSSLHPVGNYRNPRLPIHYAQEGTGQPIVVQRDATHLSSIYGDQLTFAATAVFAPELIDQPARIVLYNPLTSDCTQDPSPSKLAKDLTAPFAFKIRDRDRLALLNFIYPQRAAARPHLFMNQPYQPGKIPLILVHGLASDHTTWVELANFLNANPAFRANYQIWYYQYPTGIPFLASAAAMRDQLELLCQKIDPEGNDSALDEIVVVGHSMGGLISKLQVTSSNQEIWRGVCKVPIQELVAASSTKERLESWFTFQPSNRIQKIVLVATPHRGSPLAEKPIGKISARLVREPEDVENQLKELVANNPGAFYNELRKGYPTSIDLLEPQDEVLRGIRNLEFKQGICIESIIGTGKRIPKFGPADGVVPVSSAIELSSTSEQYIDATHTKILSTTELQQALMNMLLNEN